VLLIERADRPGYWQSVTGSLDREDEPLADTARREVAEETGITGGELRDWGLENVYEIYPVWRHRYASGVTHNTEHVFGLRLPAVVPCGWIRASTCGMSGCPGAKPPTAASRRAMPRRS
jgi:dATP pyrophosphohydrolase